MPRIDVQKIDVQKVVRGGVARPAIERPARGTRQGGEGLGAIVRRLRLDAGLTLEQLSEASRVSRAMLSSVERGDKHPTLPVLSGIAAGLGVTISELMGERSSPAAASVTTRGTRLVYRDQKTGIERHLLSPTHLDTGMEVVEHVLPSGRTFDGAPHARTRTSKCVVVIEGQLTLEIGNVVYTLDADDSVTFEVTGDYRFRNKHGGLCRYYVFMIHQRVPTD